MTWLILILILLAFWIVPKILPEKPGKALDDMLNTPILGGSELDNEESETIEEHYFNKSSHTDEEI